MAILVLFTVVGGRFVVGQLVSDEANTGDLNSGSQGSEQLQPRNQPTNLTAAQPLELIEVDVSEELEKIIDTFNDETGARTSIVVQSLDGRFSAEHDAGIARDSASLYKTLAAYAVLQRVDRGELSMSMPVSGAESLSDCVTAAITVSDNPCGITLQSLAQPSVIDSQLADWGYPSSSLAGYYPQTSAKDQAQLLTDVYTGAGLSADSQSFLLEQLNNQRIMNRLPEYDDARVFAKTGDIDGSVHSTALIETVNSQYVVVIMTDKWNENLLSKYSEITEIHSAIHELVTSNELN